LRKPAMMAAMLKALDGMSAEASAPVVASPMLAPSDEAADEPASAQRRA
jgi:hypothetical protein